MTNEGDLKTSTYETNNGIELSPVGRELADHFVFAFNEAEVEAWSGATISTFGSSRAEHISTKLSEISVLLDEAMPFSWGELMKTEIPVTELGKHPDKTKIIVMHRLLGMYKNMGILKELYQSEEFTAEECVGGIMAMASQISTYVEPHGYRFLAESGASFDDTMRENGAVGINLQGRVSPEELSILVRTISVALGSQGA